MNLSRFFTVSVLDGEGDIFESVDAARGAWAAAGSPKPRGSSVWITESLLDATGCAETIRTITLVPA